MKKLFLIRHAQAINSSHILDDYDRTITKNGINDIDFLSQYLLNSSIKPDLIISSSAIRAISTANILAKNIKYDKNIVQNQYIYEGYVNTLQEIIEYIDDSNNIVFFIGHNPGINLLAYTLCNFKEQMNTSSLVEIEFDCDFWMNISSTNSKFISHISPKR